MSVPPRTYLSAAELLAEAVERSGTDAALYGGTRARPAGGAAAGAGADPVEVLAARGYEPGATTPSVRLRNCPFHQLAEQFPPLVCGMNLALVEGVLEALQPRRGGCGRSRTWLLLCHTF